jgi:hypothetical protein
MPLGLHVEVKDPTGWTLTSYVQVLDEPAVSELPEVLIASDGGVGGLPVLVGVTITATYTTVELSEEEAAYWRAAAVMAGRATE